MFGIAVLGGGGKLVGRFSLCAGYASVLLAVGVSAVVVVLHPLSIGVAPFAILVVVARNRPDFYASLLVLSTFLSRLSADVAGVSVRPEMVLAAAAGASLALTPGRLRNRAPWGILLPILLWMGWLFFTTMFLAPVPAESFSIIAWLILDLSAVVFLALRLSGPERVVTAGLYATFATQILALAFWTIATAGGPAILVREDPGYGGFAAHMGVFEPNLLGGLLVLWAAVSQSDRLAAHIPPAIRTGVTLLCIPAAIVTHTRAALVAGLVVVVYAAARRGGRLVLHLGIPALVSTTLVLGGFVTLSAVGLEKFEELISFKEGTGHYRATTWDAALRDLSEAGWASHLYGLGLNSFGQRHLDPSLPGSGTPWYLGNVVLQIQYDSGLVGSVLVAGTLFVLIHRLRSPGTVVFVAAYLLLALSTSSIWLLQSWIFLSLGVLVAWPQDESPSRDSEMHRPDAGTGFSAVRKGQLTGSRRIEATSASRAQLGLARDTSVVSGGTT